MSSVALFVLHHVGKMELFRIQGVELLKLSHAAAMEMARRWWQHQGATSHYITDGSSSSNFDAWFKKSTGKLKVWQ